MMTTSQPLDELTDLDWSEIACQNPRRECPNPATWHTETHAVDCCNDTNNPIELLCNTCLTELRREVNNHINKLRHITPRPARPACFTCGAPIREHTDILRTIKAIA